MGSFEAQGGFYYFVKDPNRINTGIKVEPQNRPTVGIRLSGSMYNFIV